MRNILNKFLRSADGLAATEFAILLPTLVLMAMAASEITRDIIINQKTDKIAFTVADVVAQSTSQNLSSANMADLMTAATEIMNPFQFGSNGVVIVTSIYQADNSVPKIMWQYSGGGTLTGQTSKIGTSVGQTATLPAGFTVSNRDNIIITEVYYKFTPITSYIMKAPTILYKVAYYKPRLGALTKAPA